MYFLPLLLKKTIRRSNNQITGTKVRQAITKQVDKQFFFYLTLLVINVSSLLCTRSKHVPHIRITDNNEMALNLNTENKTLLLKLINIIHIGNHDAALAAAMSLNWMPNLLDGKALPTIALNASSVDISGSFEFCRAYKK